MFFDIILVHSIYNFLFIYNEISFIQGYQKNLELHGLILFQVMLNWKHFFFKKAEFHKGQKVKKNISVC